MSKPTKKQAWQGWCMYDWANSAFATVCLSAVLPVYFISLVPQQGASVALFGSSRVIPAASLWGYTVSFSMLLIALTAPYLGALADERNSHRRFLFLFCLVGSCATMLLSRVGPGAYLRAAGLFAIANICFAGGNIFYNAFLPMLAAEHELDGLSARGFAYGYVGGGLALLFVFLLIANHQVLGFADKSMATRMGFVFTGIWWAFFAVPAYLYLPRNSPSVRPASTRASGFNGYLQTFVEIRKYRDLLLFLVAFLCYNDGIHTVIVVAAVFARQELALSQITILACFLMVQFVAMPGTLFFGRLAGKIGSKRTVFVSLGLFIGITVYAYFMTQAWQFWLLSLIVALILGGAQAVSRSLFGALIPAGKSAEFFGFYAISAKFASIFGPFVFAVVAELTGSTRLSILALVVFFGLGIVLLSGVDMERGKALAREGR